LTRYHIVRGPGYNTVVNIVGPWLLQHLNETPADLYYASILLLLKPWHKLEELKHNSQSWMEAYKEMLAVKPELHQTVSNIQYHYECKDAADREHNDVEPAEHGRARDRDEADEVEEEGLEDGWTPGGQHEDEAELRKFIAMQEVMEEMIHGW